MKKELNKNELQQLDELLSSIELSFGSNAMATMFDYDDEFIDVEVTHVDGHKEQVKINRNQLALKK